MICVNHEYIFLQYYQIEMFNLSSLTTQRRKCLERESYEVGLRWISLLQIR